MKQRSISTLLVRALCFSVLAGSVVLFSPQQLLSGTGINASGEGRGDNPVVGSLPCAVDDDLDAKFFNWLGLNGQTGTIQYYLPTVALAGDAMLETHLIDAMGAPFGMVNAPDNWSAIGSVNQMTLTTTRSSAVNGDYSAVVWVPDDYLGGMVEVSSTLGTISWPIGTQAFSIPVRQLALAPGASVSSTITVTSASGSTFQIGVDVIAGVVLLDFQP